MSISLIELLNKIVVFVRGNFLLSLIVIIGFLLRIIGTSPGYYMHGYEVIYGDAVSMILNKTIGLSLTNLAYPPLVFWIMAIVFLFFFIPLAWLLYAVSHFPDFLQLVADGIGGNINFVAQLDQIFNKEILGTRYWQNAMYWGRYITALFGTASVILGYKVVMEYFGKRIMALVAAFMLAVNYRLVINSHMGFFDIYNVFFLLLALFAVGRLIKKPTMPRYIFAAVCVVLSFLVKYQPSGFVVFGIAHLLVAIKKSKNKRHPFLKNFLSKNIIMSAIIIVAIFLIAHVDYFMRLDETLSWSKWVWLANEFHKYQMYLFPLSYVYHTGLGPVLTIISLGGIIIGFLIKRHREQTIILVSPILLSFYLFAYFSTGGYYTYNLLIPIALMLIFAALFFGQILEWSIKSYRNKSARVFIIGFYTLALVLVLKEHIYNSALSTYILAQPSYRIVAEDWLNKNIEGPAVFATHSSNPSVQKDKVQIAELPNLPEIFGYREFLEEKYDYALIDFFKIQEKNFWWMLSPPRMPTQFWDKPDGLLSQNYLALATRELLWNHTIKDFMLPWQASGYNYAVTQIKPPLSFGNAALIKRFDFEGKDDWTPLFFLEKDKDKLFWSEEGKKIKGALVIKKGKEAGNNKWVTVPGVIRWESDALPVKPGFGYKVTGWIKNSEHIEKKFRNGFLRLDFYSESNRGTSSAYQENNEPSITNRPVISFVSTRPYGESQWHKVEVQGIAPQEANFIKIGFQADDSVVTLFLDEVEIYETLDEQEEIDIEHYIIPDEDFFRPSDSSFT